MTTKKKTKLFKKITTICLTAGMILGSFVGMGFSTYNIIENTQKSNDFAQGHSVQINLRLFKVDANGNPLIEMVDGEQQLVPIYSDTKIQEQNLAISAQALTTILQAKNLTNIEVSYGFSNLSNISFPNGLEKIGVLYADFENSINAFGLADIEKEVNTYLNNKKIYNPLITNYNFEIDLVKNQYVGTNYTIASARQSTGRLAENTNNPFVGVYFNEDDQLASGSHFNLQDTNDTKDEVKPYKGDRKTGEHVFVTANQNLNSWAFGLDKKSFDDVSSASTTSFQQYAAQYYQNLTTAVNPIADGDSETPSEPTAQDKYQTQYSWILWKDKQGLLNYLNSLVMLWYYNLYANEITINSPNLTRENLSDIFNTSTWKYENFVDPEIRDQINEVINNLSDVEKSFICLLGQTSSGSATTSPNLWRPDLITENDLIPVLYNFYNSSTWNADYSNPADPEASVPAYGVSTSVLNGWGWIESNNSDAMSSLIGTYLHSKIDYRNFGDYFFNPDKDAEATEPYTTDVFLLSSSSTSAQDFAKTLNDSYKFPLINPTYEKFIDNYTQVELQIEALNTESQTIDFNDPTSEATIAFKDKRQVFATTNFKSDSLFNQQRITRPKLATSWTSLNSFDILLIILSVILFVVGIFISVRYRIPGVMAFVFSSLVFVVSAALYNVFGFVFSFYTLMALITGCFLSLMTPIFMFRNTSKELKEHATLNGAILKSVKKYWKMSLDVHIISILASLAFLFFGIGGNINFGAMLIISVFLSFVLSGIIFFVLMLFYTQFSQFATYQWYGSSKLFKYYVSAAHTLDRYQPNWKIYLQTITTKLSFFNKWTYYSLGACGGLALLGIIIVFVMGPNQSLDFNPINTIVIYDFDKFGLSMQAIINAINLKVVDAYVYENQFYLYTTSNFDITVITANLKDLLVSVQLQELIFDNTVASTLNPIVAYEVVKNALMCLGIALGFIAVWTLLSLNIVSILPLLFNQAITLFILVGIFNVLRLPMNLEIIPIFIIIFILSLIINTACISSIKQSWDRTMPLQKSELKFLIESIVSKINMSFLILLSIFGGYAVLALILASATLSFSFVILIFALFWLGFFGNRLLLIMWYYCVLLRDMFNQELLHSRSKEAIRLNYDLVDEQTISSINS